MGYNDMINTVSDLREGEDQKLPDIVVAAYDGDIELVASLLNQGVDPNSADPADDLTLLHIACMQGDLKLVELLIDHDRRHGNLDYTAQSSFRPRQAWQFAANGNFLEISDLVHSVGTSKKFSPSPKPPNR
jgi:ankyrin repeat protein